MENYSILKFRQIVQSCFCPFTLNNFCRATQIRPLTRDVTWCFIFAERTNRVDLLACPDDGVTVLHDAVVNHHLPVVKLLTEAGG